MIQTAEGFLGIEEGEGERRNVLGAEVTQLVRGEQAGGRYAVVKEVAPVGDVRPLHYHGDCDELFYVLEGEIEYRVGDATWTAKAGSTILLPRNVPHGSRNVGPTPSTILAFIVPAGFEKFFDAVDELSREGMPDPEKVVELGKEYQVHFTKLDESGS